MAGQPLSHALQQDAADINLLN